MLTQEDLNHIKKILKEAIKEINNERDGLEEEASSQIRTQWLKDFIKVMIFFFIIGLILSI